MIQAIDLSSDDEPTYPSGNAFSSSDDEPPILPPPEKKKNLKGKPESKTAILKREQELRALERKRKQAMKPGNCLKLIKVVLSANLLQNDFAGDLILALNKAEIVYRVDVNPLIPPSIFWEREDPFDQCVLKENHMVAFMHAQEFINLIATYQLKQKIKEIQSAMERSTFTLVIYGLENYFRSQKTKKNREFHNEVRGQGGGKNQPRKGCFSDTIEVSREQVECSLAELQILFNCCHCSFNQPSSVASYVCQYTKAVAEAPYKLEKKGKVEAQLEWFALGDSRGTVRVDKQGNGLARLWRQQLCQFNLAGLDSSDAIAFAYPSPKALTEAYDGLMTKEAQLLLQNISVRRNAGPLSSERRIGPQLSRKLHSFFTGDDGRVNLSEDQ